MNCSYSLTTPNHGDDKVGILQKTPATLSRNIQARKLVVVHQLGRRLSRRLILESLVNPTDHHSQQQIMTNIPKLS
jgi:hypothetical protein